MWELELMMLVNVGLLLKVNVFVGEMTGVEQFPSSEVGLKLYLTISKVGLFTAT